MREEIEEKLANQIQVGVGLTQFLLDGVVQFVDYFAMDHQFTRTLTVPLFQVVEVVYLAVLAQFVEVICLFARFAHTYISCRYAWMTDYTI